MLVTISTRVRRFEVYRAIAEAYPNVYCTVGTHPHQAHEELDVPLDEIVRLSEHPKCVAIGEAGLDYYYKKSSPEAQAEGFRRHIAAARATGLPLEIHTRDADADTARILEDEMAKGEFKAVLHCFTGGAELARKAVRLGLLISFSGVITFKNSDALREVAAEVPMDRLLVETDAPFLAPVPHRGKRNEPAFVVHTAAALAAVKGVHGGGDGRGDDGEFPARLHEGAGAGGASGRMSYKLTLLGTGSSGGVPRIGNHWGSCDPKNPRNRRRRCSALVERIAGRGRTTLLIDTSPDLREQLLGTDIQVVDGVAFTHDHADHAHGIDDLRMLALNMRRRVDVYFDAPTGISLKQRFNYCFQSAPGSSYPPILNAHDIVPPVPVVINGAAGPISATPIRQEHGEIVSLGFRVGDVAYSPDVSGISDESCALLANLDLWVVDALRYIPHPAHFSVKQALAWIERLKPKRAILTHLHVDLDYAALKKELPAHIEPAYDGMVVHFD